MGYKHLTEAQVDHFMTHGYLRLTNCFTPAQASTFTSTVWTRLGMSPDDPTTWTTPRINMPSHTSVLASQFAPAAWSAICELLGGADRVDPAKDSWNDALIVNLGSEEWAAKPEVDPRELDGWHVDGDFFVHFLDSREQGLLVIPVFTEIRKGAGGTMVCPEAIGKVARHLYDHPKGVDPRMNPVGKPLQWKGLDFYTGLVSTCTDFHEMTGSIGDVILLHPLMVHSATRNRLRIPRIITNPPVALRKPFEFSREDPAEYSIVERKTLKELGMEGGLGGWKVQGERKEVIPERVRLQSKMKEDEERRLKGGGEVSVVQINTASPELLNA